MTTRNTRTGVIKYGTVVAGAPDRYKALDAVAMNAAEALRTIECDVRGVRKLLVTVVYARGGGAAGTAIQVAPSASLDGGVTYGRITGVDISGATGTVSPYTDVRTTTSAENMCLEYDVQGYDYFKLVFTVTNAGAADTIDVYAAGVPQ